MGTLITLNYIKYNNLLLYSIWQHLQLIMDIKLIIIQTITGVAATKLDNVFSSENFKSVPNIFSKDVMIEDIPSSAPLAIAGSNGLDASANWADSSYNYVTNNFEESTYYNVNDPNDPSNNMTFAQMFPDSNLKFYKRLSLVPVLSGEGGRAWGCFTDYSGNPMYKQRIGSSSYYSF